MCQRFEAEANFMTWLECREGIYYCGACDHRVVIGLWGERCPRCHKPRSDEEIMLKKGTRSEVKLR